jgi:hypothetical protein
MNLNKQDLIDFIVNHLNKNYLPIVDQYTELDDINLIKDKLLYHYINQFINSISIIDGEQPRYQNIDLKNKKVLISCLIKNCSTHIDYIKKFFDSLSSHFDNTKLFFLTNNNIDRTEIILKEWIDNNPNIDGLFDPDSQNITIDNRIEFLANCRDRCLKSSIQRFGNDFDYLIIFDTDLIEDIDTNSLIKAICIDKEWSAIFGNMTFKKSYFHYDALALRQLGESDNIIDLYPDFKKYYGLSPAWLNKLYIFNNLVEVKSAFGGIGIFKMPEILDLMSQYHNLFDISNLPEGTCEHIALCNKLKNSKFIYGDLNHNTSSSIENQLFSKAKIFIPRDAGFFSVFNFYLGSLIHGSRSYPFYNKQVFLQVNGNKNKHFAYWTENNNCWFDYFEPVSFYHNDDTHFTDNILKLPIALEFNAPLQFTHPHAFDLLMSNKELFDMWRKYTHSFYKQYIKFKSHIVDKANSFIKNNFATKNIIAVHYRHPNHVCESGKVYLQQYFDKIDSIIANNPDAAIFLATDNEFGILAFIHKYGSKVKYIPNITRLTLDNFLDWGYKLMEKQTIDIVGMIDGEGPELHHQILSNNLDTKKPTIDLLTEVNCILQCRWFVHTVSNISLAVSYMNPDMDMVFIKGIK